MQPRIKAPQEKTAPKQNAWARTRFFIGHKNAKKSPHCAGFA
jgi:hypothetical protein